MRPLHFLLGLLLSQSHYFISPVTSAGCYPGSFGLESVNLLLIYADTDSSWSSSVKRELEKTQAFASIGLFDGRTATPSLLELQKYHTVLVWATGSGFQDAVRLGDVLADYWDWGGAAIVAMFANHRSRIRGRFGDFANGYTLIDGSHPVHDTLPAALGEVSEPDGAIMAGVAELEASAAFRSGAAVAEGAVVVAAWDDKVPLVLRGEREGPGGPRPVVTLNMWPVPTSSFKGGWRGDGATLMANALLFAACTACPAGTTSLPGAAACFPCGPGNYSEEGALSCSPCPPGRFSGVEGATECEACGMGRYSDAEGATSPDVCTPCGPGNYTAGPAVASCAPEDTELVFRLTYAGPGPDSAGCAALAGAAAAALNLTADKAAGECSGAGAATVRVAVVAEYVARVCEAVAEAGGLANLVQQQTAQAWELTVKDRPGPACPAAFYFWNTGRTALVAGIAGGVVAAGALAVWAAHGWACCCGGKDRGHWEAVHA